MFLSNKRKKYKRKWKKIQSNMMFLAWSVPATIGEAISCKRNLHTALYHIGILRIGSVPDYPVTFLSVLYSRASIQFIIQIISKCSTNGINSNE